MISCGVCRFLFIESSCPRGLSDSHISWYIWRGSGHFHCKSLSQNPLPCYPSACLPALSLDRPIPTLSGRSRPGRDILADSSPRLRVISVDGVYPDPVGTSEFTQGRPSASALLIVVPLHIHSLAGACELDLSRSYGKIPALPRLAGRLSHPSSLVAS